MRKTVLAVLAVGVAAVCWAQTAPRAATLRKSGDVDWKASGSLPTGAEYHLIQEDPATHAVQTLVRFPANYFIPPHSHTHDETLVILSGKLILGIDGKETTLDAGSYAFLPGGTVLSLKTGRWGKCEILAALNGPFDLKGLSQKQKP